MSRAARPRLGVAGCGWVARNGYAPHLGADLDGAFLPGPCLDLDRNLAHDYAAATGGWAVDGLDRLASESDAVLVATPNSSHLDLALRLSALGRHCLVEKPVCIAVDQAEALCRASRATGILLKSGAVCRHRADTLWLLQRVPRLGAVRRIRLVWRRARGIPAKAWHLLPSGGWTGVLPDLGYHMIDLAGAILGFPEGECRVEQARAATAQGAAADWYGGDDALRCAVPSEVVLAARVGGTRVDLDVAWSGDGSGDRTGIVVEGESGTLSLEGLFGFSGAALRSCCSCRLADLDGRVVEEARFPIGPDLQIEAFGRLLEEFARDLEEMPVAAREVEIRFAAHFLQVTTQAISDLTPARVDEDMISRPGE